MGIYELLFYSCLVSQPLDGSYSKTCNYKLTGELFKEEASCKVKGQSKIGDTIFSDTMFLNAPNPKVDDFKCVFRSVQ